MSRTEDAQIRVLTFWIATVMLICGASTVFADDKKVTLLRTPDGGIQPQAAGDDEGTLHLIYFKGSPSAGDIFYVRKGIKDQSFSTPIRVNTQPGSAIATGSVRGAHLAVGRGGRVHVSWMGAKDAEPKGPGGATPMLYARLNDAKMAFEPQRNVIQMATGLDGGGSVAADRSGNVYVAWHAGEEHKGDAARRLWVAVSNDEGKTFKREVPASDEAKGACACCGMRAYTAKNGTLYMLYRSATKSVDRDMYLVVSKDGGKTFQSTRLHEWKLEACPMSTASIGEGHDGVYVAWETNSQVYYSQVDANTLQMSPLVAAPGEGLRRKHPAISGNSQGETLMVWTERTSWQKGGSIAWQVFSKDGRLVGEKGSAEGVAVWSLVTAFARPDGGFTILY